MTKLRETVRDKRLGTSRCHGFDTTCEWIHCPQIRDGEPRKSGRHCPLDKHDPDDEGGAGGDG